MTNIKLSHVLSSSQAREVDKNVGPWPDPTPKKHLSNSQWQSREFLYVMMMCKQIIILIYYWFTTIPARKVKMKIDK